jgi:hypothetical protein
MATLAVILFGGGDGGGLKITSHGVEKIPPYGPPFMRQLRAVNALIRVSNDGGLGQQVEEVTARMTSQIVAHVEKTTGASGSSIVFLDAEDGFVCGTGPRPFPFPHHLLSSLFQGGQAQPAKQLEVPVQV